MIKNNEVEPLDLSQRIYRMTQRWRSSACFRARTTEVSLAIPKSLQRHIADECTRRSYGVTSEEIEAARKGQVMQSV
jgi:hypothetical protein